MLPRYTRSSFLKFSVAVMLSFACLLLVPLFAVAQQVGDDVPKDPIVDGGDEGQDGNNNACVDGPCSGGDAGDSGDTGASRRGNSAGSPGNQVTPAPTRSTASPTGQTSTSRSRTSSSRTGSGSSVRPSPSPSIGTILLYPETGTPIPDPTPVPTTSPAANTEAEIEQAADPVEEPVRRASSGGFPVRQVIGGIAVLVALGSAWSLLTQGKSKRGRRSVRRTARRL